MFKFLQYTNAKRFIDHCDKIMMIIHGDDGYLWVVTPRHATQLEATGYEIVP